MKKKLFFRPRLYPDSGQRNFFVSEKETGRIPRRGSFHTGRLDSIRLEYGDTSLTLFSGDSIPWQRYGTDGVTIQADTYIFFPFYSPNSDQAIVSHGQTYAKEAYVVRFHASSENLFLTDVIYYTLIGILLSDTAKHYTSSGVLLL